MGVHSLGTLCDPLMQMSLRLLQVTELQQFKHGASPSMMGNAIHYKRATLNRSNRTSSLHAGRSVRNQFRS
jgi:hypothetical protein